MLCLVPALRALRAAHPDEPIALVGLDSARWMLDRFPGYLDEVIPFPGWPGIDEGPATVAGLPAFLADAHARSFDLALQCQGSGLRSNPFVAVLGARRTGGYHLAGQWCPDPERFLVWDGYEAEPSRWVRLVEHLGAPPQGLHLELPVLPGDRDDLAAAWPAHDDAPYACLHPGASHEARRWPPARFAEVGDELAASGLAVVLTGVEGDRPLTAAVAGAMAHAPVDLTGRLGLGGLAALLAGAGVLVTNDTGPSHVAAALGTPSVVVFRGSDPQRWAPLDGIRHRAVGLAEPFVAEQLARPGCGRCLGEGCARLGWDLADVRPATTPTAEVLAAVAAVLAETAGGGRLPAEAQG